MLEWTPREKSSHARCLRDLKPATSSTIAQRIFLRTRLVCRHQQEILQSVPITAYKPQVIKPHLRQHHTQQELRDIVGSISVPPSFRRGSISASHPQSSRPRSVPGFSAVLRNEPGEINIRLQGSVFGHQRLRLVIFTRDGGVKSKPAFELACKVEALREPLEMEIVPYFRARLGT